MNAWMSWVESFIVGVSFEALDPHVTFCGETSITLIPQLGQFHPVDFVRSQSLAIIFDYFPLCLFSPLLY